MRRSNARVALHVDISRACDFADIVVVSEVGEYITGDNGRLEEERAQGMPGAGSAYERCRTSKTEDIRPGTVLP